MDDDAQPRSEAAGDSQAAGDEEVLPPAPDHPTPWYGLPALGMFVFLVICGYIATSLYGDWVISHPIGLIALSARIRNLIGALGTGVNIPAFFVVGGLRLALAYAVCHLIGRAYGERVYYLFGRYLGVTRESIDSINQMFDKVHWVVVPWFVGSNLVAAVTGVRKMDPRRLTMLLGVGIVGRLVVLWVLSLLFEDLLDSILDWIARYQRPIIIVSILLVFATIGLNIRRGRNFKL